MFGTQSSRPKSSNDGCAAERCHPGQTPDDRALPTTKDFGSTAKDVPRVILITFQMATPQLQRTSRNRRKPCQGLRFKRRRKRENVTWSIAVRMPMRKTYSDQDPEGAASYVRGDWGTVNVMVPTPAAVLPLPVAASKLESRGYL